MDQDYDLATYDGEGECLHILTWDRAQFSKNFKYKIDQKLKNRKLVFSQVSEHCATFWTKTQFGHFSGGTNKSVCFYTNKMEYDNYNPILF